MRMRFAAARLAAMETQDFYQYPRYYEIAFSFRGDCEAETDFFEEFRRSLSSSAGGTASSRSRCRPRATWTGR